MELAQLLITPGTLLTAFIFFWKQAKTGRDELRREIKEGLKQAKASSDELKQELKADMKELKEELKEGITSVREEMHDMNGRLGRVEGLLKITDTG